MGIKHLKSDNPGYDINIINLISKIDPTKTKKLTPFLVSMFKKRLINSENTYYGSEPNYIQSVIENIDSKIEKQLTYLIIDFYFGFDNVNMVEKFVNFLDRGLIDKKDITSYKDFEEIEVELSKAMTKELSNKVKKEFLTVYEDDEWWMFKPLTHDTSVIYGYGTKWCTSMKNEPEYFYRHSINGILIYVFNKKNNRKFGCHKHFNETLRIYDEVDNQIDSFETGMSLDHIKKLFELINDNKSNYEFFSETEKNNSNKYYFNGRNTPRIAPHWGIEDVPVIQEDNIDWLRNSSNENNELIDELP